MKILENIKIPLEYQTYGKKWIKYKIPWKYLWDGYKRTEYIECKTNNFVFRFRYSLPINIMLCITDFIWNTTINIKEIYEKTYKKISNLVPRK